MAKIIFYNPDLESKVNKFVESIRGDSTKETFITFDMISARTGITTESKSASVVSAVISIVSMVNANVFVPYIERIEDDFVSYVNDNKESMVPVEFVYLNAKGWKDSTNIEITEEQELEYNTFIPKTVSVLYIAPTSRIEEEAKTLTSKSRFMFDMPRIKTEAKIDDDARIALAFPQISAQSTVEFTKILEDALRTNPVDHLIIDSELPDVFCDMVRSWVSLSNTGISVTSIASSAYTIEEIEEEDEKSDEPAEPEKVEAEVVEK